MRKNFLDDNFNIYFFFGSVLLVISSIIHNFKNDYLSYDVNSHLSWIGLANWIPFFWCYWGFKSLLNTQEKRKNHP